MHIMFIVNDYPPCQLIGGIVSYTHVMSKKWAEKGHQVSVVCQSNSGDRMYEQLVGVDVYRVCPKKYPKALKDKVVSRLKSDNSYRVIFHKEFAYAVYKEVETWEEKPDLIESPEAFGWGWYFFDNPWSIPVVVRPHGPNFLASLSDPDNAHLKSKLVDTIEMECMRRADWVMPFSKYMRDILQSKNIKVDRHLVYPVEVVDKSIVKKNNTHTLLCVGRMIPGKGMETAVEVLAELDDSWQLNIVGSDDFYGEEKKSFKDYLIEKSKKCGVEKRVNFLGTIPYEEVLNTMLTATVLMHDSQNEAFGLVVVEALCLGLPVVSSTVGGLPEAMTGLGSLVDVGDVLSYVREVNKYTDVIVSKQDREMIRLTYSPTELQKQQEDIYNTSVLKSNT